MIIYYGKQKVLNKILYRIIFEVVRRITNNRVFLFNKKSCYLVGFLSNGNPIIMNHLEHTVSWGNGERVLEGTVGAGWY